MSITSSATVTSADGTALSVYTYDPDGREPRGVVVLIHGWAQAALSWEPIIDPLTAQGLRVVALDLRGHGTSAAPSAGYDDPRRWAEDVRAVLAHARAGLRGVTLPTVVVGWSYGGLVLSDYLTQCPAEAERELHTVVLVGAITGIGFAEMAEELGPAMQGALPEALSENPAKAIGAFAGFGTGMFPRGSAPGTAMQRVFGLSLATRPHVRKALFLRSQDNRRALATCAVPFHLIHGTLDAVVLPLAAERLHAAREGARREGARAHPDAPAAGAEAGERPHSSLSLWEGAGHAPFLEDPQRFATEITGVFAHGTV